MELSNPVLENESPEFIHEDPQDIVKQRGYFLPILGVIILVLVVSAGAYYLGIQRNQTKNNQDIQQGIPTSTSDPSSPNQIPPSPSPTTDPTANWKMFTSSRFTFRYPPNMFIKETDKDFFVLLETPDTPAQNSLVSIDARLMGTYKNYEKAVDISKKQWDKLESVVDIPNGIYIIGTTNPGDGGGIRMKQALFKYGDAAIEMESPNALVEDNVFQQMVLTLTVTR